MIEVACPAPTGIWGRIAGADPEATFFQTPVWSRLVFSMGRGFREMSRLVRLQDGAQAVLPQMRQTRGMVFSHLESVPVGLYGAPVSERPLTQDELMGLAAFYRPRRSAGAIVVETPGARIDLGVRREAVTTRLLQWPAGTAAAAITQGYRKGHRSAVRQAEREGVRVTRAETVGEFLDYYGLYLATLQRWSRQPALAYPLNLFRSLGESAQGDSRIRLWLARIDDRRLAGALALHHGGNASYWHGASTEEGRRRNAGNAAVNAAIMDAVDVGKTRFDFMPSAGLSDVEHFKSGFGAEEVEVGVHHFEGSPLHKLLAKIRERMRRSPRPNL